MKNKIATFLKKHSSKKLKQDIFRVVLIGAAYFLTVHLSFLFPDSSNILMAVWPASGIGLAALLLNPRRLWLPILLAIFLTGTISNLHQDRTIINSIGFMVANVIESFTCAWLITKWCGANITFTRIKEVLALIASATIINAGTACLGAGFASLRHIALFGGFWKTWYIADGLGILLITPLIISLTTSRISLFPVKWLKILETAVFYSAWIFAAHATFYATHNNVYIQPYMLFGLIAWAAIRFSIRNVSFALSVLAVIAITHHAVVFGPLLWGGDTIIDRLLHIQKYLGFICASGLLLSAVFTEHKQVQIALQEREESYRNQFLENRAIMLLIDPAIRAIIDVNDTALKFYGYSREQMLSMLITDINSLSASEFMHLWNIVIEKHGGSFNAQHCLANGSIRDVEVSVSLIKFRGREVLHSIVQDITDRKQQHKKILEIQNRLELATSSAELGIWDWDIANKVLTWDDQMYKLYGITDRTAGSSFELWQNCLHPDDLAFAIEATQAAINGEKKYDIEFRVQYPNGAIRYIKADGLVLRDENGKAVRMLGINKDITVQKQLEERERNQNNQFRKLSANVPDLIFQFSRKPDGTYCVPIASEGIRNIFGCSPEDVVDDFTPISRVIFPDDAARVKSDIEYSAEHLTFFTCEFRVQIPGKDIQWIFSKSTPEQLPDGSITWFGFNADITKHKLAEQEHAQHELQLQRTQKLESLGVLAGGIAHDFNNMLSGIFGYMDMAKENLEANKPDKCMYAIVKASSVFERAKGLTQQLLTFSRGGTPKKTTLQLKPIIEKNTKFVLSGSNILYQFNIPDLLWVCDVDENQFSQVIDNIVINAMQAMPMGGTITLSAKNIVDDATRTLVHQQKGNFVCITIKDTGIGISKKILNNIFDPFFSTKQTGHGLGLATVHSIVKNHQGWIDVESEPDKGTTFSLYFPASLHKESMHTQTLPLTHIGTGTIVVMDDEEYVRDILSVMLSSMGYTVKLANNSEETIALVKNELALKQTIRAVILDLTIPGGIGGKETLVELQKIVPNILAIASSGYSNDPVMAMPLNYGFKASLKKPYSKNDVKEVLTKVISTT